VRNRRRKRERERWLLFSSLRETQDLWASEQLKELWRTKSLFSSRTIFASPSFFFNGTLRESNTLSLPKPTRSRGRVDEAPKRARAQKRSAFLFAREKGDERASEAAVELSSALVARLQTLSSLLSPASLSRVLAPSPFEAHAHVQVHARRQQSKNNTNSHRDQKRQPGSRSRFSSSFEDSIRACFPFDPSTLGNLKTPSKRMSSTAAASSYWRVAGMTYLKYGELCATHVRSALKEGPVKTASKAREAVYYRSAQWEGGKPTEQVITDLTEGLVDKK
jgi:F-type H+-transporting ATPase subunit epsilon